MSDVDELTDDQLDENAEANEAAEQEAAAQAKEQQEAAQKQATDADSGTEKHMVPLSVLLEERRSLQSKIRDLEERGKKYEGLESQLREVREQIKAREEAPKPREFTEDPKGYVDDIVSNNVKSLAERVKELESKGKATAEQVEQANQIQQMQQNIKASVDVFASKTADFDEALQYAREKRLEQLRLVYPEAKEEQLQSVLAVEEFRTASTMVQQNRNPGEFIYNFAKSLGYKSPESNQEALTEEQKAEMAAKRDRAEGLGSGGGTDAASLLEMDDDEFEQAMKEAFGR